MTELTQALVTVAFGALAGGVTNTLAVWMLFHPYEPPRIAGIRLRWLQGAVPKNQARLAEAIGRTVGTRLLTAEDLQRIFAEPGFRAAFDERLAAFLGEVLHQERGSLRELVPAPLQGQFESLTHSLVDQGVDRLTDVLASDVLDAWLLTRTDALVDAIGDKPVGALLTPAREAALGSKLESWIDSTIAKPDFRATVDTYLERASERVLEPDRTFEQVLPLGLVGALERAIAGYLPIAIERLSRLLDDPAARSRFESTLRELFERLLKDLRFHQRVVARLVVTDDTLDRLFETIKDEGSVRVSEMLRDPEVQAAMARGVNEAIVDFLRRPVRAVLGGPESASVVDARNTLADWLITMAGDPQTRAFVADRLRSALESAGGRTWRDVLERMPREEIARWLAEVLRSTAASQLLRDLGHHLADTLLDRRIGTPSTWLPQGSATSIEREVAPVLWNWLQTQVPRVIEQLNVAKRVETKVLEFPTPKLEELVRRVTERELRIIVRLGYLLGAIIGVLLVAVDRLFA
jgi:uncharacterized membrane protein YheB (UPF0754 family)